MRQQDGDVIARRRRLELFVGDATAFEGAWLPTLTATASAAGGDTLRARALVDGSSPTLRGGPAMAQECFGRCMDVVPYGPGSWLSWSGGCEKGCIAIKRAWLTA